MIYTVFSTRQMLNFVTIGRYPVCCVGWWWCSCTVCAEATYGSRWSVSIYHERGERPYLTQLYIFSQKIAKNVNADEAAVLGAAFRGASLSNQFRLSKQISIKDVTLFPIEVSYKPENKGKEGKLTDLDKLHNRG